MRARSLVLLLLLLAASPCVAQVTAIRAGHLVDPATGSVADDQVVLVDGGKITDVGPPG